MIMQNREYLFEEKQKMLNLDNIKYKNFKVGNLFLVEKCKCNKAGD